jgi:hypothetical protein
MNRQRYERQVAADPAQAVAQDRAETGSEPTS